MANKYYVAVPAPQAPATCTKSGTRRSPLTPSTTSAPSLSANTSSVPRQDAGSHTPTKATVLLSRVASHPASPRASSPPTSPLPRPPGGHQYADDSSTPSRQSRPEMARCWTTGTCGKQGAPLQPTQAMLETNVLDSDGYVSFPDFEQFRQRSEAYAGRENWQDSSGVKT
ncbi:hypothetical protein W97_05812 [Coniosporium apollinis CBS 100218]|uniref:Uncharacterized protein n=1 Tax=Coniosporium apollinis (strain CBS 100218) TaxID=1168221 RepID=R7YXE4_CONA1|nr:uncharacterized protein W97_05812 [Coniosporium apollinis CBS 100218]EON66567.1 hypothetical protein W97_05812 [Coniosporium apollinis CBS 100218]